MYHFCELDILWKFGGKIIIVGRLIGFIFLHFHLPIRFVNNYFTFMQFLNILLRNLTSVEKNM
jgi:hypothetical protein